MGLSKSDQSHFFMLFSLVPFESLFKYLILKDIFLPFTQCYLNEKRTIPEKVFISSFGDCLIN